MFLIYIMDRIQLYNFPKKIYINSLYRISGEHNDFIIQLNGLPPIPEGVKMAVSDVVAENVFYTLEENNRTLIFAEKIGVDAQLNNIYSYYKIELQAGQYNILQFVDMFKNTIMKTSSDGINYTTSVNIVSDIFTISDPFTSTGKPYEISITCTNLFKIYYSDIEHVFPIIDGDYLRYTQINESFNMNGLNCFFIRCPQLSNHDVWTCGKSRFGTSKNQVFTGATNIIKKVPIGVQHGNTIIDNTLTDNEFIDVSNKDISYLNFRITNYEGDLLDLKGMPISFSLLFV